MKIYKLIVVFFIGLINIVCANTSENTATPVTLTTSGNNITLSNGIVTMVINKTNADVTSLTYNGVSMFASGFYWSWTPNIEYYPANCQYTLVTDPATNGGTYAEVKLVAPYTPTGPDSAAWDVEIHYSLLQGSSGFYAAAVLSRQATYPAYTMGEWRAAMKLNTGVFDWLSVDSTRNKLMATESDWENGTQPTNAPMEVRLLNTGIYSGQYECKYGYSADLGNLDVYGWSSVPYPLTGTGEPTQKNVGIWMTLPSLEYYNGGPMKRELTGHIDLVNSGTGDLLLLNMLNGEHYGMGSSFTFAQGEAFEKVYGPFFVYCNKYSGTNDSATVIANALWQDAQNQAATEQAGWPYTWFNHPAYPQKSGRGTVTGTFKINDSGNPNASPANFWIGLAPDSGDFQLQAKTYQFWVKTAGDGSFSIPNIRPGTYNLNAFGPGAAGTFQQKNITVTAGQTLNLSTITWVPPRVTTTVWEIGIPDRDSREFYNGSPTLANEAPPYSIWPTSFINYPTQFPNGVNYTVGTSNWKTDWNYAQVCNANNSWAISPWTINFTLAQAPTTGSKAALFLGLSSNYTSHLTITVNGTQIYSSAMANGSDAVIRLGSHGAYYDSLITFNSNLLKKGANTIILNQVKAGEGNTIEYDYLRLEATGTIPSPTATITTGGATTFCQGSSVVLNANTGTGYTYQWSKGGTAISGATATSYTATASGSYTVTVTASGLSTTSSATTVTVNALPTATITPDTSTTFCTGGSVVLNANTGTGLTYQWNNGSTAISAATISSYIANTAGTYTVVVKNSNGCSATSSGTTVTVNALPTASITPATSTTFCTGGSVVLNANTGTGLTYQWNNGGTGISGATTSSYTATTADTYTVVVKNSNGCSATSTSVAVTVNQQPTVSNAGTTQYIITTSANLAANTPTSGTGEWSVVSGTGSFSNASSATAVNGLSMGANVFQWTISNGVCPASSSKVTINVGSPLTSQTIVGSAYEQINAAGVTYSVPANPGVSKIWTVPLGAAIVAYNFDSSQITVDFGASSGNISVNESNAFGSVTSSLFVAVGNSPAQQILTGSAYVVNNGSATYSITTPSGVTNHWVLPAGATITSSNADSSQVTITFGTTGGTVGVTQTNSFGSTVDSETVNVGSLPVATTISGPAYVTTGSSGVTYSVPDNTGSTYNWSLPAGAVVTSASTDSSQITISFGSQGGTIAVTETNNFGSITDSLSIAVGTPPGKQQITGTTSVTPNEIGVQYSVPPDAGSTYHWSLPAGAVITSASTDSSQITVTLGNQGGTVAVTETNSFGSVTDSASIVINSTTSVITAYDHDSYEVRPNPFADYSTIIVHSSSTEKINVNVIDVEGVTLYTSTDYYTNQEIAVGNGLPSGVYFVKLLYGAEIKVIKLVKL